MIGYDFKEVNAFNKNQNDLSKWRAVVPAKLNQT
jgi:hypothetical protein